jgi:hypothetical protein
MCFVSIQKLFDELDIVIFNRNLAYNKETVETVVIIDVNFLERSMPLE